MRVLGSGRVLYLAAAVAVFDRASFPPLLLTISVGLGESVASTAMALTAYAVAYGGAQLLWSTLSDRFGRLRVLTGSSLVAALGCVVSALAADTTQLATGRGIAGAAFAATVPGALTYFGDTLGHRARLAASANLATATSLGLVLGTLGSVVIAEFATWRLVFVTIGVACLIMIVILRTLEEPPGRRSGGLLASIVTIARSPWAMLVLVLAFAEGFSFIGVFSFIATVVEHRGYGLLLAGIVTSAYGVAVLSCGQLVRRLSALARPWMLILTGGLLATVSFVLLGTSETLAAPIVAAVLLGVAWSLSHTSMQTWMSDAAWAARSTGMSLFALSLFGGGSLGAAVIAFLPSGVDGIGSLFVTAAGVTLVFAVVAGLGRRAYTTHDPQ